jgi:hypothetical protein
MAITMQTDRRADALADWQAHPSVAAAAAGRRLVSSCNDCNLPTCHNYEPTAPIESKKKPEGVLCRSQLQ